MIFKIYVSFQTPPPPQITDPILYLTHNCIQLRFENELITKVENSLLQAQWTKK
jgi:hypothetical protein